MTSFSFDVALSFAGEDRVFVESVATHLKAAQVKVFYDRDADVYLWGKDLAETLDEIYRNQSRYVVFFISSHYAEKMWTRHERRSALARALSERREYILPARFDATPLPGLQPTVAYINLAQETPLSFAEKLIAKINGGAATKIAFPADEAETIVPVTAPLRGRKGIVIAMAMILALGIAGYAFKQRKPQAVAGETTTAILGSMQTNSSANAGTTASTRWWRIETGMHTEMIRQISVDAAGRLAVTASDDGTARVWDVASGRLIQTIEMPGAQDDGLVKVYAASLTPDGALVAAGVASDSSIYIFDSRSGKLLRRLKGTGRSITRLAFSPDGKWLVVSLAAEGIRIFDTTSWNLADEDKRYAGGSYGASFDGRGHLATTSLDGNVRIYKLPTAQGPLRLVTRQSCEGGSEPYGVAYSPSGNLVVGFLDSTNVTVVSNELDTLFLADVTGHANGDFSRVAWSSDGTTLFAAGRSHRDGQIFCRTWSNAGRGPYHDTVLSPRHTVLDAVAIAGGGFAFATAEPLWGRVSSMGERELLVPSEIADFRSLNLLASRDGRTIQFAYQPSGQWPARFAFEDRHLELDPAKDVDLQPARTSAQGVAIDNWRNEQYPTLNGKRLALQAGEISRSIALNHDSDLVLVGSDWGLYLYHASGLGYYWAKYPLPGVWSVNISGDDLLAIAALGDGTIRWYRIADGRELLAFFPHPDRRRWIAWTPSGHYDCSIEGEELLGLVAREGKDGATSFVPVSRLRGTLHRPDLITEALKDTK